MDRQYSTLRFLILIGLWVLIGGTYRLWLPTGLFPQVPFFHLLIYSPKWCDYILLSALAISSANAAFVRSESKQTKFSILSALCLILLVSLNQQRLQPWVYLALVQLAIIASGSAAVSMRLMRIVFVSVYIYSALSKFDHAFFHHLGQRFVDTFLSLLGMNPHLMAVDNKMWLIWLIPIGEFVVGIGLAFRVTRRFAVGLAVVLHATLIMVLGPWGLEHHFGVLLWNVLFATQVVILFGTRHVHGEEGQSFNKHLLTHQIAIVVASVCVLAPLSQVFAIVDHWPAWSLYSDRSDKVEIFVGSDKVSALPVPIAKHLGPQEPFSKWRKLYFEQWSLYELQAPVYPEDRFQIGVALDTALRFKLEDEIKIIVHNSPNRFTGVRPSHEIIGVDAIAELAGSFWLNARARPAGRSQ